MIWARANRTGWLWREPARWRSLLRLPARTAPDEWRVREFLLQEPACSETADSLARKLGLSRNQCRRTLDLLVSEGVVRRRDFPDIEPIYCRYPTY